MKLRSKELTIHEAMQVFLACRSRVLFHCYLIPERRFKNMTIRKVSFGNRNMPTQTFPKCFVQESLTYRSTSGSTVTGKRFIVTGLGCDQKRIIEKENKRYGSPGSNRGPSAQYIWCNVKQTS